MKLNYSFSFSTLVCCEERQVGQAPEYWNTKLNKILEQTTGTAQKETFTFNLQLGLSTTMSNSVKRPDLSWSFS